MWHRPVGSVAVGCSSGAVCRYWELNSLFCCMHRSKEFQCFSVGRTAPKITPSRGGCRLLWNTWFLGPTHVSTPNGISIDSAVLAQLTHVPNTQTDRQSDRHATPSVAIGSIYTVHVMRFNNCVACLRVQQMQAQHLPAALAAAAAHVPLGGHPVGGLPPAAAAAAGSAAGLMSLARLPGVSSAHLHGGGGSSAGAGGAGGAGSVKEEKGDLLICCHVLLIRCAASSSLRY